MTFLPIDRTQFSITPFSTFKQMQLTQNNTGVMFYTVTSDTSSFSTSSCIYGTIQNMYGSASMTVFGQKNISLPNSIRVIYIPPDYFGDGICMGTFSLTDNYYAPKVINLEDDGRGNLWDHNIWGSQYGGYYVFEGSGSRQYMTGSVTGFIPSVEDFGVEIIAELAPQSQSAIVGRRSSDIGWEVHLIGNTSQAGFFIGDVAANVSANINISQSFTSSIVHHLFITFDRSNNAIFYLDGSTGSVTGVNIAPVSASISAAADFFLGLRYNGSITSSITGNIHVARLYNFGSGGLPVSISNYVNWNYKSGSVYYQLNPYLVENWDWRSGSNRTGSVSGHVLRQFDSNGHRQQYRSSQWVGNIFYGNGLIVITETLNALYREIGSGTVAGGTSCRINLKSTVRHHEMRAECYSPAGEQNCSMNPTAVWGTGSGIPPSGSSSYEYRSVPHIPYFTTVGLYNDNYQLLAVGTLAQPLQKEKNQEMTIICRIDL